MAFGKEELKEIAKLLEKQGKLQSGIDDSIASYAKHLIMIAETQRDINHSAKEKNNMEETLKGLEKERVKLLHESLSLSGKERDEARQKLKGIRQEIGAKKVSLGITEKELGLLIDQNKEYVKQAKQVNKVNLALKEGHKFLKATPGLVKQGFGKLKSYGLFDMDKEIRMAGVSMGKMADVGSSFGKDIIKASTETQSMGLNVKDLAKMQASYSSELGRSVMLSQDGFEAMSQMASGTILGSDGAAALAAEMDRFNISVTKSRDIIEDVTDTSERMGLNAGNVIKNLQNNLKMANKYHFKGGVKGMVKMAAQAEKFHMSMETTAGFADKLFDIEGAVEMSAKLNTMGGEWAKLGDPMKLMYQARNDMEGLQTSIIDATAGMATFNKTTGEFEFSGLELHRMKELEKITGISAEQMAEMAKSKAKFAKINAQLGMDTTDEMKEFIENAAVFKDGEYKIKLSGEKELIPIDKLNKFQKNQMIADAKSLKERAENSQTFDDQLSNMLENAKTLLLPLLEGLNDVLPDIIKGFKDVMNSDFADKIKSVAKTIGDVVGSAIGLFLEFPKTFSTISLLLMGPGKWILNGISLAKGFLMSTKGFGGGAGGGVGDLLDSGGGGVTSGKKMSRMNKLLGKGGKFGAGSMNGMLAGAGLGIGSMALEYGRSQMDSPDSDGGKALGIGSSALQGAAMGMLLGPIGALVGGILGAGIGAYSEYGGPEAGIVTNSAIKDGIFADGKVTPIDSKDKVFEISKPGGAYDKATQSTAKASVSGGMSKIHISFDPIMVKTDGGTSRIDLEKDTTFIRDLSSAIKKELSKAANNGVLSPNPL